MGRKFDGVLLVSDFDNTLLDTDTPLRLGGEVPPLSEKNKAALRYFTDNGGLFTIATGRALSAFLPYAPLVPMNAPAIVCNGAALYDFARGEYTESLTLPAKVHPLAQTVLDRFPALAAEAYHLENRIYLVQPNAHARRHQHVTHVDVTELADLALVPEGLGKVLFEADHADLAAAHDWIEAQPWRAEYELQFSASTILDITAKGASKGGMVRRLAEKLGVSMAHVYCAGDESNDLSMLLAAAEGFAPANCTDAVRNAGVTIVSHCSEDAMADIVDILDRRY